MTEPDFAHTNYARDARVRKATRIEAALRIVGCDAATAAALDAKGRRDAERAAGVRKSSDETWRVVLTLMGAYNPRQAPTPPSQGGHVAKEVPGPDKQPTCPACGMEQGDPAVCHNCDGVIAWSAWQDARAPGARFCSEVCSLAHLVGCGVVRPQ